MTDFVTYGTITGTPHAKSKVDLDKAHQALEKAVKGKQQNEDNKFGHEVNEHNPVAAAQKEMSSQETAGVSSEETD